MRLSTQTGSFKNEKEKKKVERQGYVGPKSGKEDTDDGENGGEKEEVVGEDGSKVESLIAGSWRHD